MKLESRPGWPLFGVYLNSNFLTSVPDLFSVESPLPPGVEGGGSFIVRDLVEQCHAYMSKMFFGLVFMPCQISPSIYIRISCTLMRQTKLSN